MGFTSLSSAFVVCAAIVTAGVVTSQTLPATISEGDALLQCGELEDVTQLSLCLRKTLGQVKKNAQPSGYGYPHRVAPTLPPFLRADGDSSTKRRIDEPPARALVKRIQVYSEPGYRNLLDLETTVSQRVVEYRPVFGDFAVPVLLHPAHPPPPPSSVPAPYHGPRPEYYHKPVKHREGGYGGISKPKKSYGAYQKDGGYLRNVYESSPQKEHPNGYVKDDRDYKYGSQYSGTQHYKENAYDKEYFVPANSPIIGDIRRSLLDYAGARDLMVEEPDYLGNGPTRRLRFKEIRSDYYPFRRSDEYVKDLEADETHKRKQES